MDLSKYLIQSGLYPKKTPNKHFTAVINAVWITISDPVKFFKNPVQCRSGSELQNPVGSRSGNRIMFNTGTESEIFDSDFTPALAEYTPTPKHFKILDSDSCLNSKVNYLNFWQCLNNRIRFSH